MVWALHEAGYGGELVLGSGVRFGDRHTNDDHRVLRLARHQVSGVEAVWEATLSMLVAELVDVGDWDAAEAILQHAVSINHVA